MARSRNRLHAVVAVFIAVTVFFVANGLAQDVVALVATGSSMPEPLYLAWAEEFHKTQPHVQLRYLAEGTSESAARVVAGTGDFGGGEAPIPEKQMSTAKQKI